MCEFSCPACSKDFKADWTYGDCVTCTHCSAIWNTDYEFDDEDNVMGPWITDRTGVDPQDTQNNS